MFNIGNLIEQLSWKLLCSFREVKITKMVSPSISEIVLFQFQGALEAVT